MPFPPSAACRFFDLPPVNLQNLPLHLTKNSFASAPTHLCGIALEKQKGVLYGLILIVIGIACSALSATTGGSEVQDFVSGLLMGLSIVEMLTGIAVIGKKLLRG